MINVTAPSLNTYKMHNNIRQNTQRAARGCIGAVIWKLQTGFRCHYIQAVREFVCNAVEVTDIFLCVNISKTQATCVHQILWMEKLVANGKLQILEIRGW
jgi:hypothetical protein